MDATATRQRFSLIAASSNNLLAKFARDVRQGMTCTPKRLACRYFYDAEGSTLFEEICSLPEYYLTRAEHAILKTRAADLVARFPARPALVELGSGSALKTRLLIEAFLDRYGTLRYVPIDISRTMVERSSLRLLEDYSGLEVHAIAAEYRQGLRDLPAKVPSPRLILWLGSNVGNLHRPEAARFLGEVRGTMTAADALLVGIDLRKEHAVLERAYNDSRGVTADFNLNLLARINRELGGHFHLEGFEHRAVYNDGPGRIEMYLVSREDHRVHIDKLDLDVTLSAGEAIHTENSYKYSLPEIDSLAASAGFQLAAQWLDGQQRFSVNLLVPALG
jgi:dimethylhistidine N-methyltransferase